MKALDSFTVERLEEFIRQPLENGLTRSEQMELARIALAAKRAEPVYQYQSGVCTFDDIEWVWDDCDKGFYEQYDPTRRRIVYTTPQLNFPVTQKGWTSSDPANAALVMLDRIDTMDSADDDRIEDIKLIIRQLAAATEPQNQQQNITEIIPQGWIKCSDQMPENDERKPVAVYTGNCLGQGMFVASYDDNEFSDYWEGTEIKGVTHWMPLPAAPEKENG